MEAHAFPDTGARLRDAADALVNESIDGVTTSTAELSRAFLSTRAGTLSHATH
jgi:hypothetical protein